MDLYLAAPLYSSWSLRGWLLTRRFGIAARVRWVDLYGGALRAELADLPLARTVPAARWDDGSVVGDSLALAEELASRHPDAGLWPDAPVARARARWLTAEMHSGFAALRAACPMNLSHVWVGFEASEAVRADLARLGEVWDAALQSSGGPWLCGAYSAADAFFAPVAARIAGYGLPDPAPAYTAAQLADPAFVEWRELGLSQPAIEPAPYDMGLERASWPAAR
ncbi:MAG: glutathione S-transferase [Paracoccaceae bacterium]